MQRKSFILPITAVIIAAAAVALRVSQLLGVVDYTEMGFFKADADFWEANGLYLLLAGAAVMFILAAVIDKKIGSTAFSCSAETLVSKQTAALGIAFIFGACLRLYDLVFSFDRSMTLTAKTLIPLIGEALIFLLLTIIGFIVLGSRKMKRATGYLYLFICISYTMKAAELFMKDTIIVRVSDELLLLLSYVASVLFFLALGRFISGNESKFTRFKLFVFGGYTVTLSLCSSLAGYIALAQDQSRMAKHMTMHPLSETGTAIIALAVLLAIYGSSADAVPVTYESDIDEEINDVY